MDIAFSKFHFTFVLLFFISYNPSFAQFNLVPNSSFEIFDTCPKNGGPGVRYAPPWQNPLYNTTPDYFNACDTSISHFFNVPSNYTGFQIAHTGSAYADVVTYVHSTVNPLLNAYREYIEVQLTDSLIAGVDYCIQFYASACDSNKYISNNFGIYFSPIFISDTCPVGSACNLPYIPQFENPSSNNLNNKTGWTLISGTYTSVGGERYILLGNFNDSTSTIASYTGWGKGTFFIYAQYYIDDILITPCDSLTAVDDISKNNILSVYPNPSNGIYLIKEPNVQIISIEVDDILGNTVFYNPIVKVNPFKIDISTQPNGIYFLKVICKNKSFQIKLLKSY